MKSFIDSQIELLVKATDIMRKIKQGEKLLIVNPNNDSLIEISSQLKLNYFETLHLLMKDYMPGNESNVIDHGVVSIAQSFFENN